MSSNTEECAVGVELAGAPEEVHTSPVVRMGHLPPEQSVVAKVAFTFPLLHWSARSNVRSDASEVEPVADLLVHCKAKSCIAHSHPICSHPFETTVETGKVPASLFAPATVQTAPAGTTGHTELVGQRVPVAPHTSAVIQIS